MVVLGHWAVRSLMFQAADRIQMFFFRIRQFVLHRFQQLRQACSWGFFRCSTSSTVGRGGRAAHHKPMAIARKTGQSTRLTRQNYTYNC